MPGVLGPEERRLLLTMARQAIERAVNAEPREPLPMESLPGGLRNLGASFVTLTSNKDLRGCVGTLEAVSPLAEDVCRNAVAAALSDPRFPPLNPEELAYITIEVACLTPLKPLEYETPEELLASLRPGQDGVMLQDGERRATFLPKVWEKVPEPARFLDQLCLKMGGEPELWRQKTLEVFVYQTEICVE